MFSVAWSAVKVCKGTDGCSNSLHSTCIQRRILDYFSRRHDVLDDTNISFKTARSRFLLSNGSFILHPKTKNPELASLFFFNACASSN